MMIYFHFEKLVTLNGRRGLKVFISSIFKAEKINVNTISYVFCSDDYLLNINKQFLKHNYYTDIITFDLSSSSKEPKIAEIYISIDRVMENAQKHEVPLKQELHRVIFHGILHLCGYNDKSVKQIREMRKKEDYYLRNYNLLNSGISKAKGIKTSKK